MGSDDCTKSSSLSPGGRFIQLSGLLLNRFALCNEEFNQRPLLVVDHKVSRHKVTLKADCHLLASFLSESTGDHLPAFCVVKI